MKRQRLSPHRIIFGTFLLLTLSSTLGCGLWKKKSKKSDTSAEAAQNSSADALEEEAENNLLGHCDFRGAAGYDQISCRDYQVFLELEDGLSRMKESCADQSGSWGGGTLCKHTEALLSCTEAEITLNGEMLEQHTIWFKEAFAENMKGLDCRDEPVTAEGETFAPESWDPAIPKTVLSGTIKGSAVKSALMKLEESETNPGAYAFEIFMNADPEQDPCTFQRGEGTRGAYGFISKDLGDYMVLDHSGSDSTENRFTFYVETGEIIGSEAISCDALKVQVSKIENGTVSGGFVALGGLNSELSGRFTGKICD